MITNHHYRSLLRRYYWLVVPNDGARNCIGGCLHDVCVNVARAKNEFNETQVLAAKETLMRDWKRVGKSLSQDTLQPVGIYHRDNVGLLFDG